MVEVGQEDEDTTGSAEDASSTTKKASRVISVDKIRALADFVSTTAYRGRRKMIVISPAEVMHPSAANAVLKILEEPPGNTHFLLVSHQPDRILPTIRSRCFQVPFTLPSSDLALNWLKGQGIAQAELALAQGGYAPLAAAELAKDAEFWNQRKALLDVLSRPGFAPLLAAERAEPIDGPVVATILSRWAYDLMSLKSGGLVRYHLDYRGYLEQLARKIPANAVMSWYDSVLQYGRVALHPLNKRLAMESLLSAYPGS